MRCAIGQTWEGETCQGEAQNFNWNEAKKLRNTFAGHDDWRLPDIDELMMLLDKGQVNPAIDKTAFSNTPRSRFWSSSPHANYSCDAWFVNFYYGFVDYGDDRYGTYTVRLVRGGKSLESPSRFFQSDKYIDNGDGTVTDTLTGLTWMRCAVGQTWDGKTCLGEARAYTWEEAMELRNTFAGHDDWRLPDIEEMQTIIDKSQGMPAIDTSELPHIMRPEFNFWSSSPYALYSVCAWLVDFYYGSVSFYNKSYNFDVRLVRGKQNLGPLDERSLQSLPAKTLLEADVSPHHDEFESSTLKTPKPRASEEIIPIAGPNDSQIRIGHYIDNGDGTVTDTHTGLMWMRCAMGQTWDVSGCQGEARNYTWDMAKKLRHTFAGYEDWRLPDIDELMTLIDKNKGRPAIDTMAFPDTIRQDSVFYFWSSSPNANHSSDACYVYFWSGDAYGDYNKSNSFAVRLVRGGQSLRSLGESPSDSQTRNGHYIDNGDGTVTDTRNGLMWMRCAMGQIWNGNTCQEEAEIYRWDEAMALRHIFAGHEDWRLPDIDELETLRDTSQGDFVDNPAFLYVDQQVLDLEFWSSSPDDPDHVWVFYSDHGGIGSIPQEGIGFVRLVRGGQHLGSLEKSHPQLSSSAKDLPVTEAAPPITHEIAHQRTTKDATLARSVSPPASPPNTSQSPSESSTLAKSVVRMAIDQLRQHPGLFTAELAELSALMVTTTTATPDDPSEGKCKESTVTSTLPQVLSWLADQDRVALADLRRRLLPLDLLPSAVVDDINERALDLADEPALEEDGDSVLIIREVLLQVIAAWQKHAR